MEQQTGSRSGKEYVRAVCCHPAYSIFMQSTSYEIPGWMKNSWNQDARRNNNKLRYADNSSLMAEREEELKSLLMKMKEESEKAGLKLNTQKMNHFLIRSVQFSRSVMSNSLQPHRQQHAKPPCPSPAPGVYSNSCPLSQ